jgi:hypothetical protein
MTNETALLDTGVAPQAEEIIRFFEDFLEAEKPFFSRHINGFHYWHFLRFEFFDRLIIAKGWIQKPKRPILASGSGRQQIRAGWNIARSSLSRNWRSDCTKSDLLILGSSRRVRFEGRMIEPYTDIILDAVKWNAVHWEAPYGWVHSAHDATIPVVYMDSLYLEAALKMRLRPLNTRAIAEEAKFLKQFASEFNVVLEERGLFRLIRNMAFYHEYFATPLESRLRRKKVRAILMVNHYEPLHLLVTAVAKRCGIYVVELQHGTMCRYHVGYNFAHANPLETLPDEIFTFGEYWQDKPRLRANGVRLTVTGMPYYEYRMQTVDPPPHDGLRRILILSQESLGHRFAALAVSLSRALDPEKVRIIYKLHPREYAVWQQNYPEAIRSPNIKNIDVRGNVDLYALMSQCDTHIGAYSTTIIESLGFGKELILLEGYGSHYFSDLIGVGGVSIARNSDDILKIIMSNRRKGKMRHADHYWATGSLEKIVTRIEEILD